MKRTYPVRPTRKFDGKVYTIFANFTGTGRNSGKRQALADAERMAKRLRTEGRR